MSEKQIEFLGMKGTCSVHPSEYHIREGIIEGDHIPYWKVCYFPIEDFSMLIGYNNRITGFRGKGLTPELAKKVTPFLGQSFERITVL